MKVKIVDPLRVLAIGAGLAVLAGSAQAQGTPFKLGAFSGGGRMFLGLVLDDTRVIDLRQANMAFQGRHPKAAKIVMPTDMKVLIERYDSGLGSRLKAIADDEAHGKPAPYIHVISALKVLPPVMPAVILNAGANYPEHAAGIAAQGGRGAGSENNADATAGAPPAARPPGPPARPAQSAPGLWDRAPGDMRPDNPYLFLKSPSAVVGANDDVVIPKGRVNIDWECEFAVVIGKKARSVSVKDAPNYVFGYSIEFDVSDRGGRGDRKMGGGPDWLVQKNHDTFAPIGPFIVPKEFVKDPMNVRHYFTLNGDIKQDSNTSHMEYNIWENLAYGSNVMTLSPGDYISNGTPPGTNIDTPNARWMRPGDVGVCTVEGVGSQRHNIVAER